MADNNDIAQSFNPVDPNNFIGLQNELNDFTNLINKFKVGDTEIRSVLIIGNKGTGKSSLLLKFKDSISGRRDLTYLFNIEPTKESTSGFFRAWLEKIDELAPNWKRLFEKMPDLSPLEIDKDTESDESFVETYVGRFFEKMDKVDKKLKAERTRLYFFIDGISIYHVLHYPLFYSLYSRIIEEITKRQYNLFVITTIQEEYLAEIDHKKKLSSVSNVIKLEPLSEAEAQIFLRRIIPSLMKKGGSEIVEHSDRTYFDLLLGATFLRAGFDISDFVEKNINKLLKFNKEESVIIEEMSSYAENLFPTERLLRYVDMKVLESLKEKGILYVSTDYCRFTQESLLDVIKFNMSLHSSLISAIQKLEYIASNLASNIIPIELELQDIREVASNIHNKLSYNVIASKITKLSNELIEKKAYQKAYDLAMINIKQFEMLHDPVRAANSAEKVAREIEEKEYYFAGKLFVKAAKFYEEVGEESKAKRSYTRAAVQFEKQFLSNKDSKQPYMLRAQIKNCLDCYRKAKNKEEFDSVKKKALELFPEESVHYQYIKAISYEPLKLTQIDIITPSKPQEDKNKTETVDLNELEKELEF